MRWVEKKWIGKHARRVWAATTAGRVTGMLEIVQALTRGPYLMYEPHAEAWM